MEMGHNKKALLKHYARQFSASGDKHYLVLMKHQRNIIQGYARQTQVLVNKLISMKSEYHQLYRKTAKVLQYAEY
ncbi:hypothetical protein NFI00_000202 [Salmonella enterica]|nr:hypothetical protein [Salmonella enterica subsp. enterica serovar Minnesota]EJI5696499.1 hypothetical protein [Salmonella enterica]